MEPLITAMSGTTIQDPIASAQKPKAKKELPPEIWAEVIPHLRRPMDGSDVERDPNDFHQADLANVMRVSKLFYELAAPVLYERVIVSDFASFFVGVPTLRPKQPNNYITSKNGLLGLVKRLDIAYATHKTSSIEGPPIPPSVVAKLELPEDILPILTRDFNNAWIAVENTLAGWNYDPNAPLLFPNLKTIAIGSFGETIWDSCEPRFTRLATVHDNEYVFDNETNEPDEAFTDFKLKLGQVMQSRIFGRYLANTSQVEHVCMKVSTGPMTYIHNNHFPGNPAFVSHGPLPVTVTSHLLRQIPHGSWLCVVEGTTNRWIVDPAFKDADFELMLSVYTYMRTQLNTRTMLGATLKYDPQTKIEIYGLLDKALLEAALPVLEMTMETSIDELRADGEGVRRGLKQFLGISEEVQAEVELMEDGVRAGICPACGEES